MTVIIGGPRPGPGLEYAGWIVRSLQEKRLGDSIHMQLIDSQPSLMVHLGARASSIPERLVSKQGMRLLTGQAVQEIAQEEPALGNGQRVALDLTAVVRWIWDWLDQWPMKVNLSVSTSTFRVLFTLISSQSEMWRIFPRAWRSPKR